MPVMTCAQCRYVSADTYLCLLINAYHNTGVDPAAALARAAGLCAERKVFSRPWGLAGVWGGLVRDWLAELLPPDAAARVNAARVRVAVTRLPWLATEALGDFKVWAVRNMFIAAHTHVRVHA